MVHAAKEILGIIDVKGDEIQEILEKGFGGNPKINRAGQFGVYEREFILFGFLLIFICNINEMVKH